jgi:hypothetical protein
MRYKTIFALDHRVASTLIPQHLELLYVKYITVQYRIPADFTRKKTSARCSVFLSMDIV